MPAQSTGLPQSRHLEIDADERQLAAVREFISGLGAELGFAARTIANIRLAVDEACTNSIKHAYKGQPGSLRLEVRARRGWLEIRIRDQGESFDGRVAMPQMRQLVDARRRGGLGLFLMHRLMDEVRYESTPAGNEWILRKRLPRPAPGLSRRVRSTYTLRAAAVLAVLTVAVVTPLWLREGRARVQAEERALRALGFGVAEAARPVLVGRAEFSPDQTHLFEAVQSLVRQEPRLLAVTVADRDGTIWAADRPAATFTRFTAPALLGPPDAAGVRQGRERIDREPVLHMAVPVAVGQGGAELGSVHLSLRWGATATAIGAARLRLLAIALLVDAGALLSLVIFLARFLAPLQRLVEGVRTLGQGDADLEVEGPGEIGAIAAAFNDINSRYRAARESAAEHARLQEEVQTAREIQASILPQEVPEIPGFEIARLYQPAGEVGGDYYDFLPVGDGLTGVVVADVAGKGVPASLVMGMVRTALRMETRDNASAGDVLGRLHAFVAADLRKGMFVTMLYAVLDSRNRVVSYASAGHTPLLLYRARTDETFFLNPRGLPVGLAGSDARAFARQLDVERLRLHAGDLLLLYTDGITEARSAAGEEYGEVRLAAALKRWGAGSAADFVRHLEADVRSFAAGGELQDDLTLVAIKEQHTAGAQTGDLQQRLFDLVEKQGMAVVDACRQVQVSPSTYYRWKREQDADELELQHLSAERRGCLHRLVQQHPEWSPQELAAALAEPASGGFEIPPTVLHAELRALRGKGAPPALPPADSRAPRRGPAAGRVAVAEAGEDRREPLQRVPGPAEFEQLENLRALLEPADRAPGRAVLHLEGCLDSASCAGFERLLGTALRERSQLVVDLTHVTYISSRNWGLLAAASAELRGRGELVLCGMRDATRDVYQMLGFANVMRSFGDRTAALSGLGEASGGGVGAAPAGAPDVVPALRPAGLPPSAPAGSEGWTALEPADEAGSALRMSIGATGEDSPVAIVALQGVLDTITSPRLQRAMGSLRDAGTRQVLVDLSQLEFASSAGWGVLTAEVAALRGLGGELKLFGMSARLERVFELLNLGAVLRSYDLLAEAMASFGPAGTTAGAAPATPQATPGAHPASIGYPGVGSALALAAPNGVARAGVPARAIALPSGPPVVECAALRAALEPFGRSGAAEWLRLVGRLDEPAVAMLEPWLAARAAAPLLLVDGSRLESVDPPAWAALRRHAELVEVQGGAVRLVNVPPALVPPRQLGLPVHASVSAALRAHQRLQPQALGCVRLPAAEFDRDAEVRREGWNAYLALLREAAKEDAL